MICMMLLAMHPVGRLLSSVDVYKRQGKKRWYMIFGLTDETYSLLCTTNVPKDVEEEKFLLAITLLNQSYWVIGSAIGGLAGAVLPFDSKGIDFAMTALFVVIFVEQWMQSKNRIPVSYTHLDVYKRQEKDEDPDALGKKPSRRWIFATDDRGIAEYKESHLIDVYKRQLMHRIIEIMILYPLRLVI